MMFCMKCRAKKEPAHDPEKIVMKNGKAALRGICKDCGTKMFLLTKNS